MSRSRASRRLFLGNFDFEHRLAEPRSEPTAVLKRLNAELATSWLSIANDGDWIWTPEAIDADFFQNFAAAGFPKVMTAVSLAKAPRDLECIPWGWSREVAQWVKQYGWKAKPPSESAIVMGNSRSTSYELETRWSVGLAGACEVRTVDDLHSAIEDQPNRTGRWVVKAEFGMSARERILGCGTPKLADENWLRRRLTTGAAFFEPWVERIEEVGIQIDVPVVGEPHLMGITPMVVDDRGQYAGSWFAYDNARFDPTQRGWQDAVKIAVDAARHLQSQGYFGPLGIDAMRYRDHYGTEKWRPLQDINARWTMGRLSLGWRRWLKPGDDGWWQHGAAGNLRKSVEYDFSRVVPTSPTVVGQTESRHASRLIIGTDAPSSAAE